MDVWTDNLTTYSLQLGLLPEWRYDNTPNTL